MLAWAHEAIYVKQKGKIQVWCRGKGCGFKGGKHPEFTGAKMEFDDHLLAHGIKELKKKFNGE